MRQLKLWPYKYVVMGWHEQGGNGIYYTPILEDAIEVACSAVERGNWKNKATVRSATVCISNKYDHPALLEMFERAGLDTFHGIPIYQVGKNMEWQ